MSSLAAPLGRPYRRVGLLDGVRSRRRRGNFVVLVLTLGCLMATAESVRAGSSALQLDPGEIREVEAPAPRRLALRIVNRGDCSVGIVARDSARQVSLRALLRPGEVRDFLTPSAEVATATFTARSEGELGAIVEVSRIRVEQSARAPFSGEGFPCDPTARSIYVCEDGVAAPEVAYLIATEPDSDCGLYVTLLFPDASSPRVETVEAGGSIVVRGAFREILVAGRGDDADRFAVRFSARDPRDS